MRKDMNIMTNQTKKPTSKRFWIVCCLCLLALPFHQAFAVGLKNNVVVTDNTIKLGDIFYGLSRDEERVLGVAPHPGKDMVLNARTLLRIAIALDLPWRPTSSTDQVIIKREATVIDATQIQDSLTHAIASQGFGGSFTVSIPLDYSQIVLPHDQPASLDVSNVTLDRYKNTFEATVAAPSNDNPIQKFQVSGRIHPLIVVPVLKDNRQHGHIITAKDIDYIKVREGDFVHGTIVDDSFLVGMTPRRFAVAGKPLRESDIIAPRIVERGDYVTMNLKHGPLNLTAQGKALENGSKGDIIRVVNTSSNITVEAVVTGQKEVTVRN